MAYDGYELKNIHMNKETYDRLKVSVYVMAVCSVCTLLLTIALTIYLGVVGGRASAVVTTYYNEFADVDNQNARLTSNHINAAADDVYGILQNARQVSADTVPLTQHTNEIMQQYSGQDIKNATAYISTSMASIEPAIWGEMTRNLTGLLFKLQDMDYASTGDIIRQLNVTEFERGVGVRSEAALKEVHEYYEMFDGILRGIRGQQAALRDTA